MSLVDALRFFAKTSSGLVDDAYRELQKPVADAIRSSRKSSRESRALPEVALAATRTAVESAIERHELDEAERDPRPRA